MILWRSTLHKYLCLVPLFYLKNNLPYFTNLSNAGCVVLLLTEAYNLQNVSDVYSLKLLLHAIFCTQHARPVICKTEILKVTLSLCSATRTNEAMEPLEIFFLYFIMCYPNKINLYIKREMSIDKYSFNYINSNINSLLETSVNEKLF